MLNNKNITSKISTYESIYGTNCFGMHISQKINFQKVIGE